MPNFRKKLLKPIKSKSTKKISKICSKRSKMSI